jgi:hypothetical protein
MAVGVVEAVEWVASLAFESWLLAGNPIFTCKRRDAAPSSSLGGMARTGPRVKLGGMALQRVQGGCVTVSLRSGTRGSDWWLRAVACWLAGVCEGCTLRRLGGGERQLGRGKELGGYGRREGQLQRTAGGSTAEGARERTDCGAVRIWDVPKIA